MASKRELFRESRQIRNFIIGVTAVSFVAALILASLISGGIVKPLSSLRQEMRRIESGELDFQINVVSRDEVGELTQGFNRMVQRVRRLLEEVRHHEQRRMATELQAMQARINPHFLYNTLGGIRWVAMMEGNRKVADMVAALVHLLQFSARNTSPLISVRKELSLLEHYLQLMKMRHDTFDFRILASDDVADCCIIPFLLQPIVENAIFHGLIPLKTRGLIEIRVTRENDLICARVQDNGVGMDAEAARVLLSREVPSEEDETLNHIGLNNVYNRLKLQFGDRADVRIDSVSEHGTSVFMSWPAQDCGEGKETDDQRAAR
jgi:two-component system sensor histidine kinase YesM